MSLFHCRASGLLLPASDGESFKGKSYLRVKKTQSHQRVHKHPAVLVFAIYFSALSIQRYQHEEDLGERQQSLFFIEIKHILYRPLFVLSQKQFPHHIMFHCLRHHLRRRDELCIFRERSCDSQDFLGHSLIHLRSPNTRFLLLCSIFRKSSGCKYQFFLPCT